MRCLIVLATGGLSALMLLTAGPTKAADSPLYAVSGNQIVDSAGSTVVLRGLHRDGTQGGPSTSTVTPTATELGMMGNTSPGSWHAGIIRVPVGAAQWTGACPTLSTDPAGYQAKIDGEINAITAQGIVALLDLHTSTAGCSAISGHAMPDAPVVNTFWDDAARHYASNPLVAFELYNEPHFVPDSEWLNGTAGQTAQDCDLTVAPAATVVAQQQQKIALTQCQLKAPKYQAVGMQTLYDLVSNRAPGHLIVVDAPGYATSPPSVLINGSPAYGLHPYTCSVPAAACDTSTSAHANLDLLNRWKPLAAKAPVLITEMGFPVYPHSDGTGYIDGSGYYRETLAFLQAQSPQWGFIAFAFDGSATGGFSLIADKNTYTPNSTGQPVYDCLRDASTCGT